MERQNLLYSYGVCAVVKDGSYDWEGPGGASAKKSPTIKFIKS